jgi:peptidoglycan/LPS O-acetylase OafA/YrhL
MPLLAAVNDMLALLLEIGALIAIANGVHHAIDQPVLRWIVPVVVVTAVVLLWGRYAAPKSARRLRGSALLVFKACVFAAASLSLLAATGPIWAAAYATLAVIQLALAANIGRL